LKLRRRSAMAGRSKERWSDCSKNTRVKEGVKLLQDKFSRRVEDDGLQRDRDRRGSRESLDALRNVEGSPDVEGGGPIPELVEALQRSYAEKKRNLLPRGNQNTSR
jgi:hypothetical protein